MSFNGSGSFVRLYSWVNDAAANIKIRADRFDNELNGMATGLSTCITKDGQTTVTANLPMAGFRHTGTGAGATRTDYARLDQSQDGKLAWVDGGGTADAITASYAIPITTLVDGQLCYVRATAANATTTPTFSPSALTARTIVKNGGAALVAGDIAGDGHELILRYDLTNTRWELMNPKAVIVPFTAASSSGPASMEFAEDTDNGTNKITLKAPSAVTANVDIALPDSAGTIALTSNKLSAFAATSSAELAGIISDETGTGSLVFGTSPTLAGAVCAAGTTTVPAYSMTSGTNLTTAAAGAQEFDGTAFYGTTDTNGGRGFYDLSQYFRLTGAGSNISTIANFFGASSNISLVANAYYEIDIECWFVKTTSSTIVWTFTNSAAPTGMNMTYEFSPITGLVTTAADTNLFGQQYNITSAAPTVTTGSLTTGVLHMAKFKIWLQNGSGTSLKIQATSTSGTITPAFGSRWFCRRLPSASTGTFAA